MESFNLKHLTDTIFNRSPKAPEQIELKEMKLQDHKCFHSKEIITMSVDDFLDNKRKELLTSFPNF